MPRRRSFDPNVFAGLRLAPDQFPLARQVQICCDTAKLAASYLSGKAAESQPDTEQTLEELQSRVRSTIQYLEGFSAADFAGAATRVVSQPRWKGEWMTGADYLLAARAAQLLFPSDDGVRHPASQRRRARQAGFSRGADQAAARRLKS